MSYIINGPFSLSNPAFSPSNKPLLQNISFEQQNQQNKQNLENNNLTPFTNLNINKNYLNDIITIKRLTKNNSPTFIISINSIIPVNSLTKNLTKRLQQCFLKRNFILFLIIIFILNFVFCGYILWKLNLFKNYFELKQKENNNELTNIRRINNLLILKNEENQKEFIRIETEKQRFLEQIGILKKKIEKGIFSSLEKEAKQIRRSTTKNETNKLLPKGQKNFGDFIIYLNGKPFNGNEFLVKPK